LHAHTREVTQFMVIKYLSHEGGEEEEEKNKQQQPATA
jgi:hypothetical protein